MHEWALAEAVVTKVAEIAHAEGVSCVREVVVAFGELQAIDRDAFAFGFNAVRGRFPELVDAGFTYRVDPARCTCRTCGHTWLLGDSLLDMDPSDRESVHLVPEMVTLFVSCPTCASPDFAVIGGRGISLISIDA